MKHGALVKGFPVIKGLLCGSLVVSSVATTYGILVQIALFLIAALVFLDCCFVFGRETHLLTFLTSIVIGIVLGVAFSLAGLIDLYMVVAFVALAIFYLYHLMVYREARK